VKGKWSAPKVDTTIQIKSGGAPRVKAAWLKNPIHA
jgi:hypothetical protein